MASSSVIPKSKRLLDAKSIKACLLPLIGMIVSACNFSEEPSPLKRFGCISLDGSQDSVCLYRDRHLGPRTLDSLWFTGEDSGHVQAQVRRVSPSGKIVAEYSLQPLAKLDQAKISGKQFILATEDLSVGAGSYNGPLTHILDLSKPGRIDPVQDDKGHEIIPMSSLKSAWKLIPDGILEAYCAPDTAVVDSVAFLLSYDRLRFRNGKWIRTERVESGYEDFGDVEFPAESLFPK